MCVEFRFLGGLMFWFGFFFVFFLFLVAVCFSKKNHALIPHYLYERIFHRNYRKKPRGGEPQLLQHSPVLASPPERRSSRSVTYLTPSLRARPRRSRQPHPRRGRPRPRAQPRAGIPQKQRQPPEPPTGPESAFGSTGRALPRPSQARQAKERRRPSSFEETTFQLKMAADTSVDILQKVLENEILQSTKVVEEHLDAEIQKLDQMDEDELERLKQRRLEALKKSQQQKQEWLSKGHGEYREIPSERDFFQEVKESKNVVCHFYRDTTFRCQIMDKHLTVLAKKHIETKFLKLNAEKSPFLCERLRIKVIPTLALIRDGKTQDYIVGFTDLGNTDDFTTETLEWRLGCADVINYSGNLMEPPFQSQKKYGTSFTKLDKKTIRGKTYDSDSDDD